MLKLSKRHEHVPGTLFGALLTIIAV
jgi:hypothetical protein